MPKLSIVVPTRERESIYHFMYRRILITEKWKWYYNDILIPISAATTVALLSSWILSVHFDRLGELLVLSGSATLTLITAALFATMVRRMAFKSFPVWLRLNV